MSNYVQTTFFAPKDLLLPGNPAKLIKGADVDPELAAIAVAIATKLDSTSAANPSGTVGLTTVNGVLSTYMRSDGAPALSQAIAPTWTAIHTFAAQIVNTLAFSTGGSSSNAGILIKSALPAISMVQTGAAADAKTWSLFASNTDLVWRADNDAGSVVKPFMDVNRTAGVLNSIIFGNATDNMLVQAIDDGGTAQTLGWRDLPQNLRTTNYTLALSDRGKSVLMNSVGATLTIPANSSVPFPIGTTISILGGGGGSNSIAITTDTLFLGAVGTTGTRTLAAFGMATIVKISATQWFISGAGVS